MRAGGADAGMPTRAALIGPQRSTPSTASTCSAGISQRGTPPAMTPATATMASRPPNRSSASCTAAPRDSGSVVSASRATIRARSGPGVGCGAAARAEATAASSSAGVPIG